MKTIGEFFAHPKIQLALASGASIIALAWFSKRILPDPLSNLELALPPLLATFFEGFTHKRRTAWYGRPGWGVAIVLAATALVILAHLPR